MSKSEENEVFSYRYYSIADVTPIRVSIDSQGRRRGAEVPDRHARHLELDTSLLSRIAASHEVEEIDEATFERMCREIYARAQNELVPGQ